MDLELLKVSVPITYYVMANIAFSYALHGGFWTNLLAFPTMIWLAVSSLRSAAYWPGDIPTLWGLLMTTWLSHTNSVLWLEDHSQLEHPGRYPGTSPKYAISASWLFDNPRLIGTKRSTTQTGRKQQPESIRSWTLWRLAHLVLLISIYLNQQVIFPGLAMPLARDDFHPGREAFVRRCFSTPVDLPLEAQEIKLRSILAVWWPANTYLGLNICHSGLSIFFVTVLRTDNPEDWPTLFGDITEAYSIRRFWSKFWHRIVVPSYSNYGTWFCRGILRLRKGSAAERLVVMFVVFFLSGVSHSVVAWQLGDRCGWARDTMWFCGNFFAGTLEVMVLRLLHHASKLLGMEARYQQIRNGTIGMIVGYAWVLTFFFWSVPKWLYPKIDCLIEDAMAAQSVGR